MPEKFQNKYRIAPNRLQNWDYGWDGKYFITICTKNRDHFFGEILPSNKEIELSETGRISQEIWNKIPIHFPYVILDEFVVMPNHIHGILIIDKQYYKNYLKRIDKGRDAINRVSTFPEIKKYPQKTGGVTGDKNPMLHDNLSRVVRWYKGRSTFESHKSNPAFDWQKGFYEHIIKNEISFYRIKSYIENNPKNWDTDKFR